jgi:membrane dipeptidase
LRGGGGFSGWSDASQSANLTAALLQRGYDAGAIALLWGGNFLRLLRRAEEMAQ